MIAALDLFSVMHLPQSHNKAPRHAPGCFAFGQMGTLPVMTKLAATLFIAAADPVSVEKDGPWIKLLPSGTVTPRDGRPAIIVGDEAGMKAIVEETLSYLAETEMMIDYDHQSLFGAVEGVGGTAKAAGWVKEFDVRPDGIYARVEWTAAAKAAIEAGEYRYISPAPVSNRKSGKVSRIINAALVNMPALDLEAFAASAKLSLTKGPTMDEILKLLGLAEGATEADALSAIQALLADTAAIALAADLPKEADAEAITAAVKKAETDASPDPAKYVPIEAGTAMQAELKALSEKVSGNEAEAVVAAAIKDGKLAPALKDWGIALATKDPAGFQAFAASAPALTATQLGDGKKSETDADLSDTDLQVMSQMGLKRDDMVASKKELG